MRISRQTSGTISRALSLGIALLALSSVAPAPRRPIATARLLSIGELPDSDGFCEMPGPGTPAATSTDENVLAFLSGRPVYAQDSGTVDLTRPPVRDILDTAPIYSS